MKQEETLEVKIGFPWTYIKRLEAERDCYRETLENIADGRGTHAVIADEALAQGKKIREGHENP